MTHTSKISRSFLFAMIVMLSLHAFPASINCASPANKTEELICSDQNLLSLDEKYNQALNAAASNTQDSEKINQEDLEWKSNIRNSCTNPECISFAYSQQIARLNQFNKIPAESLSTSISDANKIPLDQQPSLSDIQIERSEGEIDENQNPTSNSATQDKQTEDNSAAPSENTSKGNSTFQQAIKLGFWIFLGSLILLIVLGMGNRVVIFFNMTDVWWSISPFVFILTAAIIGSSVAPSNPEKSSLLALDSIILGLGIAGSVLGICITYFNAVKHNKSIPLGILVGSCKVIIALLMALIALGPVNKVFSTKSKLREVWVATLVLTVLGFFYKSLVNGERVYKAKGWQLPK